MTDWLNHVAIGTARNGTTSNTVDPSSTGTVVAGSAFTPTAGRLLVCFIYGAVTSTTPSGWTLPASGSAINAGGLYVFWKTAAGSDTLTTTHNSSNYPIVFDFYEFQSGSTFNKSATATGVAKAAGAGPTLSSLTGTNWLAGIAGQEIGSTGGNPVGSMTWNTGTELTDTGDTFATTGGYNFGLTALDSSANASQSFAATVTSAELNTVERLVVAVTPAGAVASIPDLVMAPRASVYSY